MKAHLQRTGHVSLEVDGIQVKQFSLAPVVLHATGEQKMIWDNRKAEWEGTVEFPT